MVFIVAEVGINHNGDLSIAKKLIDIAVSAGCNAVKFQKRNVEKVYPKDVLDMPRESPWGTTTREQKHGLELSLKQFSIIDKYCKKKKILWYVIQVFCSQNYVTILVARMDLCDLSFDRQNETP